MPEKVRPGQRVRSLPASLWNDMGAVVAEWRGRRVSQDADDAVLADRDATRLLIRNDTGADLPAYSVVAIGAPWVDPGAGGTAVDLFTARTGIAGEIPDEARRGRFAVVPQGVLREQVTEAIASGVVVCRVLVRPGEEAYQYADIEPGAVDVLRAVPCGSARILWRESGTCERWAIVRIGDDCQETVTTTTPPPGATTTTTTVRPEERARCSGVCDWTWNQTLQIWELDSDTCGAATTTTSSSTSTTTAAPTTTTTTADPCGRPTGTTTTSTSSTTTSTTGTTPAPDCRCSYPTWCGWEDGVCTRTSCVDGIAAPRVNCTTTTSSTTTTTQSCDCATTTTTTTTADPALAACVAGCDWAGRPTAAGAWVWERTRNGCASYCSCVEPTGNPYCNSAYTPCITTTTTTPSPPPPCGGTCEYWWLPETQRFVFVRSSCTPVYGCGCTPPTVDGDLCRPYITPCADASGNYTTSTTTPQPCWQCYTSTTSSTSTTTTTLAPCDAGWCLWQWLVPSTTWSLLASSCQSSCPCETPTADGVDTCSRERTPCRGTTTTTSSTTTSTSSTTTSSTTTSTTCCPDYLGDNVALMVCDGANWVVSAGCGCDVGSYPQIGGLFTCGPFNAGAQACVACESSTTTTTCCPFEALGDNSALYVCDGTGWQPTACTCPPGSLPNLATGFSVPCPNPPFDNRGLQACVRCTTTTSTTTTSSTTTSTTTTTTPAPTTTTSTTTTTTPAPTTTTSSTSTTTTSSTTTSSTTTSSTTTTTTTTTTCNPASCTGFKCFYVCDGTRWNLSVSNADPGCCCDAYKTTAEMGACDFGDTGWQQQKCGPCR